MKSTLRAMSLSLLLMSPMALSTPIMAQEYLAVPVKQVPSATSVPVPTQRTTPVSVAQTDVEIEFFFKSYNYYDAVVLARFWNEDIVETKARAGRKFKWGGESQAYLEQALLDARIKALGNASDLDLYRDSGYGYSDAEALARLWGDPSPYEAKLRIERNLIMGNLHVIQDALKLTQKRD